MYRTEQDRIDAQTLRLDNPERVMGSGYIHFPPQIPFAQPITQQPPTMAAFGNYQQVQSHPPTYGGSYQQDQGHGPTYGGQRQYQAAQLNGHAPQQYRSPQRASQAYGGLGGGHRTSQDPTGYQNTYHAPHQIASGYQSHPPRHAQHQNAGGYSHGQQRTAQRFARQNQDLAHTSHANGTGSIRVAGEKQPNELVANFRSLAVGEPVELKSDAQGQGKEAMSKSQAKRHRKKMREGKLPG